MKNETKCGFVAIVGRPNVGKSSLTNAIVGMKVSITGPKAQTTRNKILGIKVVDNTQLVFVDTPGILKPTSKLGEYMQKSIDTATVGVDVIMVVIDATKIGEADYDLVKKYSSQNVPLFVVLNKIDVSSFEKVYPKLERLNKMENITEFVSVSAKTGENVDKLLNKLKDFMPTSPFLYDTESITDKSVRFIASEIIREKALLCLNEEIPHGLAVDITNFNEGKNLDTIEADIYTTKENHKQIIIGKNGSMLKKIGTLAREEIENMQNRKVNLKLFIKVREGWQDNQNTLNNLGYDKKSL